MKPAMAVLVDGDQIGPEGVPALMERLAKDWSVQERVCVRNWRSTRDQLAWRDFAAAHSFHLVQRDPVAAGKNASDIELAVIAMDLFHRGVRGFCLVSGDTDFTPLVERLRRADCTVEWVPARDISASRTSGRRRAAKAPAPRARPAAKQSPARAAPPSRPTAKAAATPAASAKPAPARVRPAKTAAVSGRAEPGASRRGGSTPAPDIPGFARNVRRTIATMRDRGEHEKGWVSVNRLGSLLTEQSVNKDTFGFPKRRALWEALQASGFQVEQMETGQYRVTMS